jgi:hypothetical protein
MLRYNDPSSKPPSHTIIPTNPTMITTPTDQSDTPNPTVPLEPAGVGIPDPPPGIPEDEAAGKEEDAGAGFVNWPYASQVAFGDSGQSL